MDYHGIGRRFFLNALSVKTPICHASILTVPTTPISGSMCESLISALREQLSDEYAEEKKP